MTHNDDSDDIDLPELEYTAEVSWYDRLPPDLQSVFDDIIKYRVDPAGIVYGITLDHIMNRVKALNTGAAFAVNDVLSETHQLRGLKYDPVLASFIKGSGGQIGQWNPEQTSATPIVLRGITKRKIMWACEQAGRDFFYIDTGYFGNGKAKNYHRITRNAVQNFGPIIDRPGDRLEQTGQRFRKFRRDGSKILLAPPSQKLLRFYNIDLDTWMTETITEIKKHTDREIVVRLKQLRKMRQSSDTIEAALEQDIWCLVTYSSIAAGEALLCGKPAITLGPNAAAPLCSHSLADIENPRCPGIYEVEAWARHLAYCQFSVAEMENGTAWRILNDT